MTLPKETRERIRVAHNDALQRLLAAEGIALELTRRPVERASNDLANRVLGAGDDPAAIRRATLAATGDLGAGLAQEFTRATLEARRHARRLALGQVATELGMVRMVLGSDVLLPRVEAAEDTSVLDTTQAAVAGNGMVTRFTSAVLATLMLWRKKEASPVELQRALRALPLTIDGSVRRHAVTQSVDAYNDEQRGSWKKTLSRVYPLSEKRQPYNKRQGPYRTPGGPPDPPGKPPRPPPPTGPEQGLPYGWATGLYEVWTAVHDRKTCRSCFDFDGRMVPPGKPFGAITRPPAHGFCRCMVVTIFVPASAYRKLPGIQIDYGALKEDIRDYFRGAKLSLTGVRHAEDYIRESLRTSSPETLTQKFLDRRKYLERYASPLRPRIH